MSQQEEKFQKRRLRGSRITSAVSISLVLILLGIQVLLIGYANKISDYVKENIGFTVLVKEYTQEKDIEDMIKILESNKAVKASKYISKEEAAAELSKDVGEDFVEFLGFNPLLASIEVKLNAIYTHPDSITRFESEISRYHLVKEVYYQKDLLRFVNDNVTQISYWLTGFGILLLLATIMLINNTMRLLMYSKRYTINTMQLVGATANFIRKPFILKSFTLGVSASLIAWAVLSGILFFANSKLPDIINANDFPLFIFVFILITLVGIFFTMASAFFSVTKYIKMRNTESIHY